MNVFAGESDMHRLGAAHDWARTPLGPVAGWPQSLKTIVRTLLASRYPMVLVWGDELTQIYNDAYSKLIGDKHPAALGIDIRITLAEAWGTLGPMIAEVMRTGAANWTQALMLLLERAGYREESYFSVSHAPAEDDAGAIVGMLAVCTEVTQQVLGERRLRLLRDLASSAGDRRDFAETCRDLLAAMGEHPLDLPFAALYLPDGDDRLALAGAVGLVPGSAGAPHTLSPGDAALWDARRARAGGRFEVTGLAARLDAIGGPFGDPVQSALVMPLGGPGEELLAVLVVGVSPARTVDEGYASFFDLLAGQLAAALRHARAFEGERRRAEAVAALDRAKTAFFSNVSHELRTPLTLILGPLEEAMAAGGRGLHPPALHAVHRNALRLLGLVNTLLDFSRIEAGRLELAPEPVDLPALTVDLASAFRGVIEGAGLRFVVDCPPSAAPLLVDPGHWEKIVFNLLSNAFKFTFEGEIRLALRIEGESVQLVVADTGTGIPPEAQPRLFERFHRVEGARSRSFEGTGIGLALVDELVRLHSGTVRVESALGKGSTFVVAIPALSVGGTPLTVRRAGDRRLVPSAPVAEPAVEEIRSGPRGRILVADDNPDMRGYLKRLLAPEYVVEVVSDGEAALAAAIAAPPDLVLADVMMPGLDGFALLRALRRHPALEGVPVVLLSARAGEEAAVEGLETGADDYLVKPFSPRELVTRVRTHLELARVRRGAAEAANHRRWLEQVLDQMPTPLLLLEPESARVLFANAAAERAGARAHLTHVAARAAAGERLDGIEAVWQSGDGPATAIVHSALLPAAHGHPAVVVLAFQDVTRGKRVEADLQRALSARDEFISVASHELKTPLTPLQLELRLLERRAGELVPDPALATWFRDKLRVLRRQGDRLDHLISELLDVSRLRAARLSLALSPVDLVEVVRDVVARFDESGALGRARCEVQIAAAGPVVGRWDAFRLEQVVTNVLENALKFGPGKPVRFAISREGATATLAVEDRGIGVPPADRARIFERFERAVSERHYGGLGLGLWITRQIVEALGGTIAVEGEEGARFVVSLPLAGPAVEEPARQEAPPALGEAPAREAPPPPLGAEAPAREAPPPPLAAESPAAPPHAAVAPRG